MCYYSYKIKRKIVLTKCFNTDHVKNDIKYSYVRNQIEPVRGGGGVLGSGFAGYVSLASRNPDPIIQWNLDLTKSLGTGQICSLNGGFVISKTSL